MKRRGSCWVVAVFLGGGCADDTSKAGGDPIPSATKVAEPEPPKPIAVDFSIRPTVTDDPLLEDLPAIVEADVEARASGVTVQIDRWDNDELRLQFAVPYLEAESRAALASYLGSLQGRHPELRPRPGHAFAFEEVPGQGEVPKRWRSHLIDKSQGLAPREVAAVSVLEKQRCEITVDFLPADGAAFASLTENTRGHKLAITVADRVVSAPIVMEAIVGGQVRISGTDDPASCEALHRVLLGR